MTTPASGSGTAGAGTFGDVTPIANVPVLNGRYQGSGTGVFHDADGDTFVTSTDVSVWIFPGDNRFDLRSDDTVGVNIATGEDVNLFELDFNLQSGTLNGNALSADVQDTGLRDGTFTGTLYGPNGEELGAVFELKDADSSHIGSMGAVRVTR